MRPKPQLTPIRVASVSRIGDDIREPCTKTRRYISTFLQHFYTKDQFLFIARDPFGISWPMIYRIKMTVAVSLIGKARKESDKSSTLANNKQEFVILCINHFTGVVNGCACRALKCLWLRRCVFYTWPCSPFVSPLCSVVNMSMICFDNYVRPQTTGTKEVGERASLWSSRTFWIAEPLQRVGNWTNQ